MKWMRQRVLSGELMAGTFLNLGSSLTAEMTGQAGFDWVLIDLEHGAGDRQELLLQMQALESTPAVPIVRIAWNDPVRFKRVLDLGLSGVMVPYIQTPEEAARAVAAMRFPPAGIRGVAAMNRACDFGPGFDEYFKRANTDLLTVIQIETKKSIECIDEIAAVDGVDVLYIGPLDLSVSLGVPQQLNHALVREAFSKVVNACRKAGKIAGLMLMREDQIGPAVEDGFTFLALSSDGGLIANGMRKMRAAFQPYKSKSNPAQASRQE
ncbi:MAG: aldolase/citrate lyase family protein [Candidatus Acidiferrales bacterium]